MTDELNPPPGIVITTPAPDPDLRLTLQELYNEVYAEPPYSEGPKERQEFVDRWNSQARQPDFSIVLAHDEKTGELIGFTFGLPLATSGWWRGLLEPACPEFTREDGRRTFAIIELAVKVEYRRQGIGRALHARLLDGRTEERITLLVRSEPEATPARQAYLGWGYSTVGRLQPAPDAPVYVALVRQMTPCGPE